MGAYRRYDEPPERLTWYHVPFMLRAEAGCLKHNRRQYPIHGIPNNAVACIWMGLLADSPDGVVLTDLGRTMLAAWKASPEGRTFARRNAGAPESAAPQRAVARVRRAVAMDQGALWEVGR